MTETRWKLSAWGNPPDISGVIAEIPDPAYELFCEEPYHQQWYSVPATHIDLLALSARHPGVLFIAERRGPRLGDDTEIICLAHGGLLAEVTADPFEVERAWLAAGFTNIPPDSGNPF
jgi:hypothetical protein